LTLLTILTILTLLTILTISIDSAGVAGPVPPTSTRRVRAARLEAGSAPGPCPPPAPPEACARRCRRTGRQAAAVDGLGSGPRSPEPALPRPPVQGPGYRRAAVGSSGPAWAGGGRGRLARLPGIPVAGWAGAGAARAAAAGAPRPSRRRAMLRAARVGAQVKMCGCGIGAAPEAVSAFKFAKSESEIVESGAGGIGIVRVAGGARPAVCRRQSRERGLRAARRGRAGKGAIRRTQQQNAPVARLHHARRQVQCLPTPPAQSKSLRGGPGRVSC
jgi:hypothetical protein